jgi:hypothetical protein
MLRVLPVVLVLALYVYTFIDWFTSPRDDVRTFPKLVWLLLIVVIPILGAVAWLVFGRPARAPGGGGGGGGGLRLPGSRPQPPAPPGRRPGPIAPDDDPDFLRGLDDERRRSSRKDGKDTDPEA